MTEQARVPSAPVPPQNLEAEESVLGAMMLSPQAIDACSEILVPLDFYRNTHAVIYRAALDLHTQGEAVDAITLTDHLAERGELSQGDDQGQVTKARIHELAALVPDMSRAAFWARIVKEQAQLRSLIRSGAEIQRLGWDRPGDVENLIDRAQELAYELSPAATRTATEQVSGPVNDAFRRMSDLFERGVEIVGVPSGFRSLDRITLGFEGGNLIVLAARPSMGKTALAMAVTANIAIRQGLPVAVFSMEMSKQELVQRLLACEAHVDLSRIRAPARMPPDAWPRLTAAAERIAKAPILVNDTGGQTLLGIRSDLRRTLSRHPNLGLVVVDYLQLMEADAENRTQEVTKLSKGLKAIASDFGIPILALSQLSRAVEMRADKHPQLSDLRESGSIEQDANIVMFLYRDGYYHDESLTPDLTDVTVAKNRNGSTGKAELMWKKTWATFTEVV